MPFYNSFKGDVMTGAINLSADTVMGAGATIKVVLLSASYTPDIDAHTRYSSISAHEISLADPGRTVGYTGGGLWLSGVTFSIDNSNDRAALDASDSTWPNATITARYAAIVKVRGGHGNFDNLLGYIDFGSNQSSSNGNFTISWNALGVMLLT